MGQLAQIKLIDFMNSNIILITSKNMTWFLKKLQDKKKLKKYWDNDKLNWSQFSIDSCYKFHWVQ
jgi:hypothetical protein